MLADDSGRRDAPNYHRLAMTSTSASRLRESPLRERLRAFAAAEHARRRSSVLAGRGAEATGAMAAVEPDYLPYGPDGTEAIRCEVLANLDSVEVEYAALRSAAGLLDANHRGTLVVRGPDRRDFLNRMVTADLKELPSGRAAEAFWLNRKGRIEADLLIAELGDRIVMDCDLHAAAATAESLGRFLVSEDASVSDETSLHHHLWLLGPRAGDLLAAASGVAPPAAGGAAVVPLGGVEVTVIAVDWIGTRGFVLIAPREQVGAVWDAVLAQDGARRPLVRPVGWLAFNVARIESGTPLFQIDFSGDSLPHETGVLARRVSFRKGCYLGQEIVARMESLGRPKQQLVGLRVDGRALPIAGGQVFAGGEDGLGEPIGTVTSSTISPLLGAAPIAFAMLRTSHADRGTRVRVAAEGEVHSAEVVDLRFIAPPAEPRS